MPLDRCKDYLLLEIHPMQATSEVSLMTNLQSLHLSSSAICVLLQVFQGVGRAACLMICLPRTDDPLQTIPGCSGIAQHLFNYTETRRRNLKPASKSKLLWVLECGLRHKRLHDARRATSERDWIRGCLRGVLVARLLTASRHH